jgi:transglutaminase-like putative cysteine protease
LPPDFRRQHITGESFVSKEMTYKIRRGKAGGPRRAQWQRRPSMERLHRVQLTYQFRCVLGTRRPTPAMMHQTHTLDAAPPEGYLNRPSARIESDAPEIEQLAEGLVSEETGLRQEVRALFEHVTGLALEDSSGPTTALGCLRQGSGDSGGKSRLLIALCRNRQIPARLLSGLILADEGEQQLHFWMEAWVEGRWLPMCPTYGLFDTRQFPEKYLVLQLGDEDLFRSRGLRLRAQFFVRDLLNAPGPEAGAVPLRARSIWRRMTLGNLRLEDQEWVKFALLLPVGALLVCFYRTFIGITTFGTFGPALLGLVSRDLPTLPWALAAFVAIMLVGWVVRRILDRFHLLMVPRIAALLTILVILLIWSIILFAPSAVVTGNYIALLPLIILTHMVERFWTVETEDSTLASFRTLIGTVVVAVSISLVVNFEVLVNSAAHLFKLSSPLPTDVVRTTLFRYPEILGLVLAAQLLLGRYTGYRLTELFRFRDLLLEEEPFSDASQKRERAPRFSEASLNDNRSGGEHEPADQVLAFECQGRAGNEPAQHRVHPGPEPAEVFPPGGRQEDDARPVPGDRRSDA